MFEMRGLERFQPPHVCREHPETTVDVEVVDREVGGAIERYPCRDRHHPGEAGIEDPDAEHRDGHERGHGRDDVVRFRTPDRPFVVTAVDGPCHTVADQAVDGG